MYIISLNDQFDKIMNVNDINKIIDDLSSSANNNSILNIRAGLNIHDEMGKSFAQVANGEQLIAPLFCIAYLR